MNKKIKINSDFKDEIENLENKNDLCNIKYSNVKIYNAVLHIDNLEIKLNSFPYKLKDNINYISFIVNFYHKTYLSNINYDIKIILPKNKLELKVIKNNFILLLYYYNNCFKNNQNIKTSLVDNNVNFIDKKIIYLDKNRNIYISYDIDIIFNYNDFNSILGKIIKNFKNRERLKYNSEYRKKLKYKFMGFNKNVKYYFTRDDFIKINLYDNFFIKKDIKKYIKINTEKNNKLIEIEIKDINNLCALYELVE